MQLLGELLGALAAGSLVFLIARQAGVDRHRSYGAVAIVPVVLAALLAVPLFNEDRTELADRRESNKSLNAAEAQVKSAVDAGISIDFFGWVAGRVGEDETFHLEIGQTPDEARVGEVGVRQAVILQWGMYQLAPRLAFEQSPQARDVEPGEGRNADWLVFYEYDPSDYPGPLRDVETYAPGFAIARSDHAG